jgi:hypothetical protein
MPIIVNHGMIVQVAAIGFQPTAPANRLLVFIGPDMVGIKRDPGVAVFIDGDVFEVFAALIIPTATVLAVSVLSQSDHPDRAVGSDADIEPRGRFFVPPTATN